MSDHLGPTELGAGADQQVAYFKIMDEKYDFRSRAPERPSEGQP